MNCKYYILQNGIRVSGPLTIDEVNQMLLKKVEDTMNDPDIELESVDEDGLVKRIIANGMLNPEKVRVTKNNVLKQFRLLSDGILIPDKQMIMEILRDPASFELNYSKANSEAVVKMVSDLAKEGLSYDEIITNLTNSKTGLLIENYTPIDNEMMAGNIHRKQFLMRNGDQPYDMTVDEFEARLNKISLPKSTKFDFFLQNVLGKHLYIVVNGSDNYNEIKDQLQEFDFPKFKDEDGKIYRLSDSGEILYPTNGLRFYIKKDPISGISTEYIVLNNEVELNNVQTIMSTGNYRSLITNYLSNEKVAIAGLNYNLNYGDKSQKELAAKRLDLIQRIQSKDSVDPSEYIRSKYSKEDILEKIEHLKALEEKSPKEGTKKALRIKIEAFQRLYNEYDSADLVELAKMINEFDISEASIQSKSFINKISVSNKDLDSLFKNAYLADLNKISVRNKKLAIEMHSSFNVSLDFLTARIPGQDKQSYMSTKIVSFLHKMNNIAVVNPYNLWFTGGDYDIDKVFSMGYSVFNGKLVGWTKYTNYNDSKYLKLALLLPHPDNRTISFSEDAKDTLTDIDVAAIRMFKESYDQRSQVKINSVYKSFVNAMRKIQGNKINFQDPSQNYDDVIDFLNDYFSEQAPKNLEEAGLFNTYVHELNESSRDIANQVHHQRAMDMQIIKDAGNNPAKDKITKSTTLDNPSVIAEFKQTNMIGKEVIGIVATGLKVYSSLVTYYMNKLKSGDYSNMGFLNKIKIAYENENGEKITTEELFAAIGTINFDRLYDSVNRFSEEMQDNAVVNQRDFIKSLNLMEEYGESTALVISALLSAATDNAKELILGKINSGPETAGMYMYALIMGNDFNAFAKLMTSKAADVFINSSKKILFNHQTFRRNLDMYNNKNWIGANFMNFKDLKYNDYIDLVNGLVGTYKGLEQFLVVDKDKKVNPKASLYELLNAIVFPASDSKLEIGKINSSEVLSNKNSNTGLIFRKEDESFSSDFDENFPIYDDYYDDYGTYDQTDDYLSSSISHEVDKTTYIHRAFEELNSLKEEVSSPDFKLNEFYELIDFYNKAKSIRIYGSILNINQGLKSNTEAQIAHANNFGKMIDTLFKIQYGKADSEQKARLDELDTSFDLKRFLEDDYYKESKIQMFNILKTDLNYLDVLDNSPHFKEMLKGEVANMDFFRNKSFKFRSIENMFVYVKNKYMASDGVNWIPNQKQIVQISKYIDTAMIFKFLRTENISVKLKQGSKFFINDGVKGLVQRELDVDKEFSMESIENRATFINWFEDEVIPNLQKGQTMASDGSLIDNVNLKDNVFLNEISNDFKEDWINKNIYKVLKPGIDTMNIKSQSEKDTFEQHKIAFLKLGNVYYNGQNVMNLLYLYNLLVNKDKAGNSSFTLFYEKSAENMNPNISFYHLYSKFISDIDSDANQALIGDEFIGESFFLAQDESGPHGTEMFKRSGQKLDNEKFGFKFGKFNTNREFVEQSPIKGYVDKYLLLTDNNQFSNVVEGKRKPRYYPDIQANNQIMTALGNAINERYGINVDLEYNTRNSIKASVDLINRHIKINTANASAAEPMHELMHVVLELINMKDNDLYLRILSSVSNHPLYNEISKSYGELEGADLDEEVFVNVFTNIFNDKVQGVKSETWNNINKKLFKEIDSITDQIFTEMLGKEVKAALNASVLKIVSNQDDFIERNFNDLLMNHDEIIAKGLNKMQNKLTELGMEKNCD